MLSRSQRRCLVSALPPRERRSLAPSVFTAAAVLGVAAFAASPAARAQTYSVTPLNALPAFEDTSSVTALSHRGMASGWSAAPPPAAGGLAPTRAFRWTLGGGLLNLGELTGDGSVTKANAINERAQAAGVSKNKPFLWSPEVGIKPLALPVNSVSGVALGMNDLTQVVGFALVPIEPGSAMTKRRAFLWNGAPLGENNIGADPGLIPGAAENVAVDVNNLGFVVGNTFNVQTSATRPFIWGRLLGSLAVGDVVAEGYARFASAINEQGTVVGFTSASGDSPTTPARGYFWSGATGLVDVGSGPGSENGYSRFLGVAANGSVGVGKLYAAGAPIRPALWSPSTGWINLLPRTPGASEAGRSLFEAVSINDWGQIAINGQVADGGVVRKRAFTLTPNYSWITSDVSVGPDGAARIAWEKRGGGLAVWKLNGANNDYSAAQPAGAPSNEWRLVASSVGGDGMTRLLLSRFDGAAAIWKLNAANTEAVQKFTFGPLTTGWRACDLAVGTDNQSRLLWRNGATGQTAVWRVEAGGAIANSVQFNPSGGWVAEALAIGRQTTSGASEGDGMTRVLWNNVATGQVAVWLLGANFGIEKSYIVNRGMPYRAKDIAVGLDGDARVLYQNLTTGGAVLHRIAKTDGHIVKGETYAPSYGWTARSLAMGGAEDKIRLLWSNLNGQQAVWRIQPETLIRDGANGPYGPLQ